MAQIEEDSKTNDITQLLLQEVTQKLKKQEDYVRNIAYQAENLYKNRQRELANCSCSIHTCSTIFIQDLHCYDKIRLEEFCQKYKQEKLDPSRMGIRLPPGTDPANLNDGLKSSLCTFR